jgi:hypothetical protein
MSALMQEKNRVNAELLQHGNLYNQWQDVERQEQQRQQQDFQRDFEQSVRDEAEKLFKQPTFKEFGEIRKAALKGDNPALKEKFDRLETQFREALTAANSGPRAQTKIVMEVVALRERLAEFDRMKAENERLKKRFGVMERVREAPLKPNAGHGNGKSAPEKTKLNDPGTRGGLDKAFSNWKT